MHNLKQQDCGQISDLGICLFNGEHTTYLSRWLSDCWNSPPFTLVSLASVRFVFKEDATCYILIWPLQPQTLRFSIFVPNCRDCSQLWLQRSVFYVWRNEYILPLYTVPFRGCFSGLVSSFWCVFLSLPSLPIAFTGKKENYKSLSFLLNIFCEVPTWLKIVLFCISVSKIKFPDHI